MRRKFGFTLAKLTFLSTLGVLAGCNGGVTEMDAGYLSSPKDGGSTLDSGTAPDDGGVDDTDGGVEDGGVDLPSDAGRPIKYIVVLVKENHTFDNYFTGFPGATSSATATLSTGATLNRPAAPKGTLDRDLCHRHECTTTALNANKMNGLDRVPGSRRSGKGVLDNLAYIRYTESQIPNYWKYARNFVLADHFFSTTTGPSFPGHFATVAGYNFALENPTCHCGGSCKISAYDYKTCKVSDVAPCWDTPSVVQELPPGYTWAEYGTSALLSVKKVAEAAGAAAHFKSSASILTDLKSATQPNLMFVHMTGATSEHPPQSVCPGENLTVQYLNAIMNNPHWKETAVFLLWDDWGGFYDSVSPAATKCATGDYMNPGFRIPLIVISPYAKKGYVMKGKAEQASIVKSIEDLWGLPRMAPKDARLRDVSAGSLMDAFDFDQDPRAPFLLTARTCN